LARFAEEHDSRLGVKDAVAGAVVAVVFVAMLAATWQRWTHPIIDHGREMNVPARILAGDRLYVDVFLHYGPFAPYFNALLYTLFGINLSTLHGSGIVCAAVIVALIYWLARQLLDPLGVRDHRFARGGDVRVRPVPRQLRAALRVRRPVRLGVRAGSARESRSFRDRRFLPLAWVGQRVRWWNDGLQAGLRAARSGTGGCPAVG
jgi:hypothetical protein